MDTFINEYEKNELIKKWNEIGLNIYLSVSVDDLSLEIKDYFNSINVSLKDYASLVMLGNGGKLFGEQFTYPLDDNLDPFDTLAVESINPRLNCLLLYPNSNYVPPLQKILRFFNFSQQSIMGMDISFDYGLWFGVRSLFLSKEIMPQKRFLNSYNICEDCKDKSCINNCPGFAISNQDSFNISNCSNYRFSIDSKCADRCLARISCPYKHEHQYELKQLQYHMTRLRHLEKLRKFKN